MVLLKCIECGGQVSANANRCPKCGTPWYKTQEQIKLEKRENPLKRDHVLLGERQIIEPGPNLYDWIIIIFVIIVIALFMFI